MAYGLTKSVKLVASSSQYMTRAKSGSSNLFTTSTFTWESWVKFTTLPSAGAVMNMYSQSWANGGNLSFTIQLDNTGGTYGVRVRISSDGSAATNNVVATYAFTTATWTHIAVVYTAGSTKIEVFVNGTSIGSNSTYPGSIFNGTDPVVVGAEGDFSNRLDGQLSLMRFWKTTRTASDISSNYCSVLGSTTNLGAEWTLDNVYTDNSGNSNTLTAVNTPTFQTDTPSICAVVTNTSGMFQVM